MTRAGNTYAALMRMGLCVVTTDAHLLKTLERAGCFITKRLVRPEVRKEVYVVDTETVWGAGVEVEGFNDDVRASEETESRVFSPAVYEVDIPAPVFHAYGSAVWMLESFSADEIDSMYRLSDKDFTTVIHQAHHGV